MACSIGINFRFNINRYDNLENFANLDSIEPRPTYV